MDLITDWHINWRVLVNGQLSNYYKSHAESVLGIYTVQQ